MIGQLYYKFNTFLNLYVCNGDVFGNYFLIKKWKWKVFNKKDFVGKEKSNLDDLLRPFIEKGYILKK